MASPSSCTASGSRAVRPARGHAGCATAAGSPRMRATGSAARGAVTGRPANTPSAPGRGRAHRHAHAPAAAERLRGALLHVRLEGEPRQDGRRARLRAVRVYLFQPLVHLAPRGAAGAPTPVAAPPAPARMVADGGRASPTACRLNSAGRHGTVTAQPQASYLHALSLATAHAGHHHCTQEYSSHRAASALALAFLHTSRLGLPLAHLHQTRRGLGRRGRPARGLAARAGLPRGRARLGGPGRAPAGAGGRPRIRTDVCWRRLAATCRGGASAELARPSCTTGCYPSQGLAQAPSVL